MVHNYGQMVVSMLDNGKTTKLTAKGFCITLMVTVMMDNGRMIKQMDMVSINILMVQNM